MPRILGLINARGGSKGVPGKNAKNLLGKPLIAWSIETAQRVPLINRTMVSTDDEAISHIAQRYGASAPFLRPPELATDSSLQIDVIVHAVEWLEKNEADFYEYICLLQPTCPVRSIQDVQGALELLLQSGADCVITVSPLRGCHPLTFYTKSEDSRVAPFLGTSPAGVMRQAFPEMFWRTGSVYAMKRDNLNRRTLYGEDVRGFEVPPDRGANIDDPLDWDIAEFLLKRHLESGLR